MAKYVFWKPFSLSIFVQVRKLKMKKFIRIILREIITLIIALFFIMLIGVVAHESSKFGDNDSSNSVDIRVHYLNH